MTKKKENRKCTKEEEDHFYYACKLDFSSSSLLMDSLKSFRFITHQSFFSAVRSGDLETLKNIIDNLTKDEAPDGSSLVSELMAMQNDTGETALYISAANNFQDIFSCLLKFCDVEIVKIRSRSDMNTFHVAAKKGHLGMILAL